MMYNGTEVQGCREREEKEKWINGTEKELDRFNFPIRMIAIPILGFC
jgi:hypothetical protein